MWKILYWWRTRIRPWLGGQQLLVAAAMALIAWALWHLPQHAEQNSKAQRAATAVVSPDEGEARTHAAKKITDLLIAKGIAPDDAAAVANEASDQIVGMIKGDTTGETARVFGGWLRSKGEADASKEDAAVLPSIQGAIKEAARKTRPSLLETFAQVFDSIGSEDVKSLRDGFFGGLGSLPWDVVKDLIGGVTDSMFGSDQKIEVQCACCEDKDKDGDKKGGGGTAPENCPKPPPPVTCPEPPASDGSCPSVVLREFDVPFGFKEKTVQRSEQREVIKAAAEAARAPDSRVTLWARTDSAGSDEYNVRLARQRGDAVQQRLEEEHVPKDRIRIAPLGEYRLLVRTGDNQPNDTNRTLTIEVRSESTAAPHAPSR